jgi:FdhD protein
MTLRPSSEEVAQVAWRNGIFTRGAREIPDEVPVALTYDGSTHAVMMATPADLEDFALGFSLTEGVIADASDIESLEIVEAGNGIEARMWLSKQASGRHRAKKRSVLGPTGCGLCGVESIEEALKPVSRVQSGLKLRPELIAGAMAALQAHQALNRKTRAVHAAGLWMLNEVLIVREDVGRHNALDKVVGAAVKTKICAEKALILLTSRVSVELVQKTAYLGAPIIAAVSVPTAQAIRVADSAGITVAAILRSDGFEIFTYPERILEEASADVT